MNKKLLLLIFTILFSSCSKNSIENSKLNKLTKRDDIYYTALLNTQKGQIIASFETKALLIATYLNPIFNDRECSICLDTSDGEYFLLGVFINGDRDNNLNGDGYVVSLNGVKPLELKELDRDDPFLKNMPMVNNWSKYYIAKFPKLNRDKLILNFKSDTFGEDNLKFVKSFNKP